MSRNYLSFDLGASSGRAIIGTLDSGRLTLREVHRFANGPVKHGHAFYWDYPQLVEELKSGLRKALAVEPQLDGIAVDTWGVDYVFFRSGHQVRLPYNYRDERTLRHEKRVFDAVPREEIYRRTGIQHMAINTLFQLVAHYREFPEDFEDSRFLMMPDALEFALGGNFTTEYTIASTSNLLNLETREWDWELIDRLGLPRGVFPPIAPACSRGGTLSAEVQRELGCGAIPILKIGSHDTASAVAAVPAIPGTDWAYVSCGTWALLGAEIQQGIATPESEKVPFTNEGGLNGTIRFLTNIMGCWLLQECRRNWREAGDDISFNDMCDLARVAEPGKYLLNPNAALFVAPGDMPGRIAEFCRDSGQGELSDRGALIRAIYDSLALCFADKLEALGQLLGKNYQALNIVGGGTKDDFLMQMAADAAGIPVVAGPVEATAAGNLLGQALTLGDLADLAELRQVVANSFEVVTYRPDPAASARLRSLLPDFRRLCAIGKRQ